MNSTLTTLAGISLILGLVGILFFGIFVVIESVKKNGNFKKPGKYVLGSFGFIAVAMIFGQVADTFYPQDYSQLTFEDVEHTEQPTSLSYADISANPLEALYEEVNFTGIIQGVEVIPAPNDADNMTALLLSVDGNDNNLLKVWIQGNDTFFAGEEFFVRGNYMGHQEFGSIPAIPMVVANEK